MALEELSSEPRVDSVRPAKLQHQLVERDLCGYCPKGVKVLPLGSAADVTCCTARKTVTKTAKNTVWATKTVTVGAVSFQR